MHLRPPPTSRSGAALTTRHKRSARPRTMVSAWAGEGIGTNARPHAVGSAQGTLRSFCTDALGSPRQLPLGLGWLEDADPPRYPRAPAHNHHHNPSDVENVGKVLAQSGLIGSQNSSATFALSTWQHQSEITMATLHAEEGAEGSGLRSSVGSGGLKMAR